MSFIKIVKSDFRREYELSSYRGHWKKIFHVLTSVGFQAVLGFRLSHWCAEKKIPIISIVLQRLTELWAGVSISPKANIGSGLVIYHFGSVMINQAVVMGQNCSLHHEVTLGNRIPGGPSPKVGNGVVIGAGAKVLGGVTIGNYAEIGANAVVLEDVPDYGVAVGIPAKTVRIKEKTFNE